jgi:hypothetical protein
MTTQTFKVESLGSRWVVRFLGPDMRPCMSLTGKSGQARIFKSHKTAYAAAVKAQKAIVDGVRRCATA